VKYIPSAGVPIKAWVEGVPVEPDAAEQLQRIAKLPVVWPHVAVMPDVHLGKGATVGSVIPTKGAIIPAAVGVDLGCGMLAVKLSITADQLPDSLAQMRFAIEAAVPHGRTCNGGPGDVGAWGDRTMPADVIAEWNGMRGAFERLAQRHPDLVKGNVNTVNHLCTLGTGNHFIEVCLGSNSCLQCGGTGEYNDYTYATSADDYDIVECDCGGAKPAQSVWVMLHTGSRGVGNRIGSYFIGLAKRDMEATHGHLPEDKDLAYLDEGTQHFADYVQAVSWAQDFARINRELMLRRVMEAINEVMPMAVLSSSLNAVNCHHNYVQLEDHFGQNLWVTRKGAVSAQAGELGIIPGSMGTRSYIVRGKGNPDSLCSCSHGAGRRMSRGAAERTFTVEEHIKATEGVECRKDASVIDETPGSYKDIESVIAAQSDLIEVVATLKQVLCVKG
jgi:tRNA-splicing ligase RtcB